MAMNNFLEQFKKLPKELQEAVASEEKVKILEEIEKKYNLKLAKLMVRLMIKDILWSDLEKFCQENFKLSPEKASELKKDLSEKIFNKVMEYLEEIPKPKIQMPTIQPPLSLTKSLEEIVKEIKEKSGLTFADKTLEKRFENTCLNFLKEIRKDFETEEILTRSEKIGGLNLNPEKAKEIVNFLKEIKDKSYKLEKEKFQEIKKPEPAKEILKLEETVKPLAIEEMPIETEKPKEVILFKEEKKPEPDLEIKKRFDGGTITPVFKRLEEPLPSFSLKSQEEKKEETKEEIKTEEIPVQIRRPISEEKLIEDVSPKIKILGPVEELKEITLSDLKRWGGKQTCQIVFNKISLLAEESLLKKAEGIKAWQQSPLYRLYLEIGEEALEKKKSVEEVIQERIKENKETISLKDFEEITELNRKLRF